MWNRSEIDSHPLPFFPLLSFSSCNHPFHCCYKHRLFPGELCLLNWCNRVRLISNKWRLPSFQRQRGEICEYVCSVPMAASWGLCGTVRPSSPSALLGVRPHNTVQFVLGYVYSPKPALRLACNYDLKDLITGVFIALWQRVCFHFTCWFGTCCD